MTLNFKTDLKEMRENDPAGKETLNKDYQASENYDTPGHVRNLCFVWPDGRMKFMNYAYLISGDYNAEECSITLLFTNYKIVISGINLKGLFIDLVIHNPKIISCNNLRYADIIQEECVNIYEIVILERSQN